MSKSCPHLDRILGLNEQISRRDFLDGALVASGGLLLGAAAPVTVLAQNIDWTGYTGEGDYRTSAGNMEDVLHAAHAVRDGQYDKSPAQVIDTGEIFDCVIVGGGFSGLSAALFFKQRGGAGRTCGGWMTKHVVRDLDADRRTAYDQFIYSPFMVANVAVRNWNFLYKLGISGGEWFEGFGRYVDVRKMATFGVDTPYVGPDLPTVLTFFVDFTKPGLPAVKQGHRGRMELLSTPYSVYERAIREQMTAMFASSGFDAKRDIAGIVLNRWGHAFINPQPGFFFGSDDKPAPRDALRNAPFGRIAFSHSDLAGAMDHRNAFKESYRAVGQLLDQVFI